MTNMACCAPRHSAEYLNIQTLPTETLGRGDALFAHGYLSVIRKRVDGRLRRRIGGRMAGRGRGGTEG